SAGHGERAVGVQRPLGDVLTQRPAVHPLADDVGAGALVDRVVHVDEVGVHDPARRDGGVQHLDGGRAARVPHDDRNRPAQYHVGAPPDQPAEGVVADVLLELVPLRQHLPDGGRAGGQHPRRTGRLGTFVHLGHPSSLPVELTLPVLTLPGRRTASERSLFAARRVRASSITTATRSDRRHRFSRRRTMAHTSLTSRTRRLTAAARYTMTSITPPTTNSRTLANLPSPSAWVSRRVTRNVATAAMSTASVSRASVSATAFIPSGPSRRRSSQYPIAQDARNETALPIMRPAATALAASARYRITSSRTRS